MDFLGFPLFFPLFTRVGVLKKCHSRQQHDFDGFQYLQSLISVTFWKKHPAFIANKIFSTKI